MIQIHPSVTEQQRLDPRFTKLLRDCEKGFNSPLNDNFKLLIGLHEAGHAYFARKAGATQIRFRGPTLLWDDRPQYNCPAISRAATIWTPADACEPIAEMKAAIAGYIVRRELSGKPNDQTAIESDLDNCRNWFYQNVGEDETAFNTAVRDAEDEILIDLRSPKTRHEIWAEARRFVNDVFPAVPKSIRASRSGKFT